MKTKKITAKYEAITIVDYVTKEFEVPDEIVYLKEKGISSSNSVIIKISPFKRNGHDFLRVVTLNYYDWESGEFLLNSLVTDNISLSYLAEHSHRYSNKEEHFDKINKICSMIKDCGNFITENEFNETLKKSINSIINANI